MKSPDKLKLKTVQDGEEFFMTPILGENYCVSRSGKVYSLKRYNMMTLDKQHPHIPRVMIYGTGYRVLDILLEAFYNYDKATKVVTYLDGDPSNLCCDNIELIDADEYGKILKPTMDNRVICKGGVAYILFTDGSMYHTYRHVYLNVKSGYSYGYFLDGKMCGLLNLFITHFDLGISVGDMRKYHFEGDGKTMADIKPRKPKQAGKPVKPKIEQRVVVHRPTPGTLAAALSSVECVKFNCIECKLPFAATSIKQIVLINKTCMICAAHKRNRPNEPIVVTECESGKNHVCKRCHAEYRESVDKCVKCECLAINDKASVVISTDI